MSVCATRALIMALHFGSARISGYDCLGAHERSKVRHTARPTVRLMQGEWGSQWAEQYVIALYLQDVLGLDVAFYPDENPSSIEGLTGLTYPDYYWSFIADNKVDIVSQFWPGMDTRAGADAYYAAKTVIDAGSSRVSGEHELFIPEYMLEDNPTATSPHTLSTDRALRSALRDAYTKHSDRNWVRFMHSEYGVEHVVQSLDDPLKGYKSKGYVYDYPDEDNPCPIIFGLAPQWGVTKYMAQLIDNLGGAWGLDFKFVPLGTPDRMTEFIEDLYSKRLPFVVSLEAPSVDFAFGRRFAKVSLPRNPSNSEREDCYAKSKQCNKPLADLRKLANPGLAKHFPEMLEFTKKWTILTSDVNSILEYHQKALGSATYAELSGAEQHKSWMDAACKWLEENLHSDTVKDWYVDIEHRGTGASKTIADQQYRGFSTEPQQHETMSYTSHQQGRSHVGHDFLLNRDEFETESDTTHQSHKTWLIVISIILAVLAAAVVYLLLFGQNKKDKREQRPYVRARDRA